MRAMKQHQITNAGQVAPSWSFQILPSLYQSSQKVDPSATRTNNMSFLISFAYHHVCLFVVLLKRFHLRILSKSRFSCRSSLPAFPFFTLTNITLLLLYLRSHSSHCSCSCSCTCMHNTFYLLPLLFSNALACGW